MTILAFLLMGASLALLIVVLKPWVPERNYTGIFRTIFGKSWPHQRAKKMTYQSLKRKEKDNLSRHKGLAFEKYVTTLLPRQHGFQLVHWRGDKYNKGVYALSSQWPDLEYQYRQANNEYEFAIECKWRSSYYKGQIQLCDDYQLKNYQKFSHDKKIPVYIALGVGGSPDNPAELYIIPLDMLSSNLISRYHISRFKKSVISRPLYVRENRLCYN